MRHVAKLLMIVLGTFFITSNAAHAQIVCLGASNTAGKGVGASSAFPAQLEAILSARGRPMSVSNAGISGDTTAGMLARLSSTVPKGTRIVVVQYGGNDARRGGTDRRANIAQIQQQLQARRIRVIQADGLVRSALQSGLRQSDGIHLTEAGHRRVAEQLAAQVR